MDMARSREAPERIADETTLLQFRYFAAAAETRQFSKAATTEHVSQSAIPNAVLTLEQHLAVRLFAYLPQGVALTAEGHHFYQHAPAQPAGALSHQIPGQGVNLK